MEYAISILREEMDNINRKIINIEKALITLDIKGDESLNRDRRKLIENKMECRASIEILEAVE